MNKIYLGFFISLFSTAIQAQTVNFEWAKSIGGTSVDQGYSISTTTSGNVYITGYFQNTVDFDPGMDTFNLTSNGSPDVFIQKLDTGGNFIWAKSMGGASSDYGYSITTDASGNVLLTGKYIDTADFDPGGTTFNLTSNGLDDIFIQKLDANGNFVWAKSMGGTSIDYGYDIITDDSGNVYVTGYFFGAVDFDPGGATFNLTSNGLDDIFIQKLDANGNFVWAKSMGGTSIDYGYSITIDTQGNVYVTGYYQDTVDFDPGVDTFNLASKGVADVFVQKLDADGNFIWAQSIGGTATDHGKSISTDAEGNVFVTGRYTQTVDFDPGVDTFNLTSNGGSDIFIQKIDTSGNFIWAKSFGGTSNEYCNSGTTSASGNVYVTGYFFGTVDFDPGVDTLNLTSNSGSIDGFIQNTDRNGNFIWAQVIGGTSTDAGNSITIDTSGNLYVTGRYTQTVDFDPGIDTFNLTTTSLSDVFILKLGPCVITGTDNRTECNSYDWIDGNTYSASNNVATFNIVGGAANGCDSLVTLDLIINTVNTAVSSTSPSIIANATGATYQWLDCGNNYAVITGESAQSFIATMSGDYAVEVTGNGCTDTSLCTTITIVGIEESALFNNVSVRPNPTQGMVTVELGNLKEVSIKVLGVNGQLIYNQENINASVHEFELEEAPGVYLIEISAQGEKLEFKIVKQ